jgi:hypothetical protein
MPDLFPPTPDRFGSAEHAPARPLRHDPFSASDVPGSERWERSLQLLRDQLDQAFDDLEDRLAEAERRIGLAEARASVAESRAGVAEQRATDAEQRANEAHLRVDELLAEIQRLGGTAPTEQAPRGHDLRSALERLRHRLEAG